MNNASTNGTNGTTAPENSASTTPQNSAPDGSPVKQHGKLTVDGTTIKDEKGEKFQLRGVSTHGIAWFPQYINKEA